MDANQLVDDLAKLFPQFEAEWYESTEGDPWSHTLHAVWMSFAPFCRGYLESATKRDQIKFCKLINQHVSEGGNSENAVSTCLLEHASQIGIRTLVRKHLSPKAKLELR